MEDLVKKEFYLPNNVEVLLNKKLSIPVIPDSISIQELLAYIRELRFLSREYRYILKEMGWKPPVKNKEFKEINRIYNLLLKKGRKVQKEKTVKGGRIDIFIEDIIPKIIEIKKDISGVANGIGQLFKYKKFYPDAELYIHCIECLSPEHKNALFAMNIKIFREENL